MNNKAVSGEMLTRACGIGRMHIKKPQPVQQTKIISPFWEVEA